MKLTVILGLLSIVVLVVNSMRIKRSTDFGEKEPIGYPEANGDSDDVQDFQRWGMGMQGLRFGKKWMSSGMGKRWISSGMGKRWMSAGAGMGKRGMSAGAGMGKRWLSSGGYGKRDPSMMWKRMRGYPHRPFTSFNSFFAPSPDNWYYDIARQ